MVSDIVLSKDICRTWVKDLIENFGETAHTTELLAFSEEQLLNSTTYVDFFANIVMELFKDYGLLIVDSGNSKFRLLQNEYFTKQIEHHAAITHHLLEQQSMISKKAFQSPLNQMSMRLTYFIIIKGQMNECCLSMMI